MQTLTDADFPTEVLQATTPALVDFSATWCGPCKAMEPVVERLAAEYEGRLKVFKVDVSQAPGVAAQFMIHSVPTFLVFSGGAVVQQLVGAVPEARLRSALDAALAG